MIWIFILILVYWIAEAFSESMTWMASWHSTKKITPKTYHLVRLPETLAIIGAHLFIGYLLKSWHGVLMVVLMEIIGCILYERTYCAMNYKDFWYQKKSLWLGIKHPPIWMEVILFIIAFIGLIIM